MSLRSPGRTFTRLHDQPGLSCCVFPGLGRFASPGHPAAAGETIITRYLAIHMESNLTTPTPEMLAFYERRTREHIERVRKCLALMADVVEYGDELVARAKDHDA